jgi:hypothetical protein
VKLIGPVIRAVQNVVEARIVLLGSTGKARPCERCTETRPTATREPIDKEPFVARRKLHTKMPAPPHRLLREDAAR